jgi:hypothetical protein
LHASQDENRDSRIRKREEKGEIHEDKQRREMDE